MMPPNPSNPAPHTNIFFGGTTKALLNLNSNVLQEYSSLEEDLKTKHADQLSRVVTKRSGKFQENQKHTTQKYI
jgi:hypothetical protein